VKIAVAYCKDDRKYIYHNKKTPTKTKYWLECAVIMCTDNPFLSNVESCFFEAKEATRAPFSFQQSLIKEHSTNLVPLIIIKLEKWCSRTRYHCFYFTLSLTLLNPAAYTINAVPPLIVHHILKRAMLVAPDVAPGHSPQAPMRSAEVCGSHFYLTLIVFSCKACCLKWHHLHTSPWWHARLYTTCVPAHVHEVLLRLWHRLWRVRLGKFPFKYR